MRISRSTMASPCFTAWQRREWCALTSVRMWRRIDVVRGREHAGGAESHVRAGRGCA